MKGLNILHLLKHLCNTSGFKNFCEHTACPILVHHNNASFHGLVLTFFQFLSLSQILRLQRRSANHIQRAQRCQIADSLAAAHQLQLLHLNATLIRHRHIHKTDRLLF